MEKKSEEKSMRNMKKRWSGKFGELAEDSEEKIRNLINDLKSTVNKLEEQYNDECNQYISTLENYKMKQLRY